MKLRIVLVNFILENFKGVVVRVWFNIAMTSDRLSFTSVDSVTVVTWPASTRVFRQAVERERYPGNEAVVVWFMVLYSLTFLWQLVKLWRASHFYIYIFFKKSRNRLFISSFDLSLFVLFIQGRFFVVIWKRAERVSTWEFCQMCDVNNTKSHAPRCKFAAKVPPAVSRHTLEEYCFLSPCFKKYSCAHS